MLLLSLRSSCPSLLALPHLLRYLVGELVGGTVHGDAGCVHHLPDTLREEEEVEVEGPKVAGEHETRVGVDLR